MKRRKVCILALILAAAVALGIFCYYQFFFDPPQNVQGGTLVYEQHVVYPDRQKC